MPGCVRYLLRIIKSAQPAVGTQGFTGSDQEINRLAKVLTSNTNLVQGSRPTRISTLVWAIELPQKTDRKSFLDRLDIIYLCSGTASSMLTRTASSIGYENVGTYTASFAGPKMDERSDAAETFSISPQESVVSEK